MSQISGILLAAGQSRRFGSDKRLHTLPGEPHSLLLASTLKLVALLNTLVVLRPGDDALAAQLQAIGARTRICADAHLGMGHSLAAGVAATPDSDGWLIALADMPLVSRDSYQAVITALQQGASLARPRYRGKPGHPVGFARHWYSHLTALRGDEGARGLLQSSARLQYLDVNDPGILLDIDTPPSTTAAAD